MLVNKTHNGGYVSFREINEVPMSLDVERKKRLNLGSPSLTADLLEKRFNNSKLSELIQHKEFMEADYFIFIQTICHAADLKNLNWKELWYPRSSLYLGQPPSYIVKSESRKFLAILAKSSGCKEPDLLIEKLRMSSGLYHDYWQPIMLFGPLTYFKFEKLGSWP